MTIVPDPFALDALEQQVLNCICEVMNDIKTVDQTYPGCPNRACVIAGSAPHILDDCCKDSGQLSISVTNMYLTGNFPQQDSSLPSCSPTTTAVELTITVARCSPSITSNGNAPSCDALSATAGIVGRDMLAIRTAILCCVPEASGHRKSRATRITSIRPLSDSGACVGTVAVALFDLQDGCKCGEPGDA